MTETDEAPQVANPQAPQQYAGEQQSPEPEDGYDIDAAGTFKG